ncbi:MAG: type II secretion system protein [Verrucomicrobiota bacterium JB024]|nr:type II secretion system protein [Verrucomicrobiota bacterium JB024]
MKHVYCYTCRDIIKYPKLAGSLCAFSLVELLVAVAIVGLLMAIVITGVGAVRMAAYRSESVSNLRQLGVSVSLYAQDNNGDVPTIQTSNSVSSYWWSQLSPYLNNGTTADTYGELCLVPSLSSSYQSQKIADFTGKAWLCDAPSYGMNWYLNYEDSSNTKLRIMKLSSIPHPAETLLMSEASFTSVTPHTGLKPEALANAASEINGSSLVYNGGAIGGVSHFLWVDGHVSPIDDAQQYGWGDPYGPSKARSIWNRGF